MLDLTSSCFSFADLIEGHFLYVDKTEYIWKLVRPANNCLFLARPRRFGKSLTLSTLKAVFEGKKELFRGLAIYNKPYDWKPYPVIHLNLGNCDAHTPEHLRLFLVRLLKNACSEHGIQVDIDSNLLSASFEDIIRTLAKTGKVVILVDEYDKPILDNITAPCAQEILSILKGFYSTIKACDAFERFVFITGVSKFSHVSMFSDLNNLNDISMTSDYATMLGYTQQELETAFAEHLEQAAQNLAISREQLLSQLKEWYNGYRFHKNAETVYNPVSIAKFFGNGAEFNNYWFSTGTPTFLMKLMQQKNFPLEEALKFPVPAESFDTFEINALEPLPLLFQTGYLTINATEQKFGRLNYHLDFPNHEVSISFSEFLLNSYANRSYRETNHFCYQLLEALQTCDMKLLEHTLKTFFAGIPYDLHHHHEANFQNIFFAIFRLLGYNITAEARTSNGRIDAVCETDSWLYLFEFKLNDDPSALQQIHDKEYFAPYLLHRKRIMLIGANFDTDNGQLCHWQAEEWHHPLPHHAPHKTEH